MTHSRPSATKVVVAKGDDEAHLQNIPEPLGTAHWCPVRPQNEQSGGIVQLRQKTACGFGPLSGSTPLRGAKLNAKINANGNIRTNHRKESMHGPSIGSANLESRQGQCRENGAHNPEASHYPGFRHALMLINVMDRRSAHHPLPKLESKSFLNKGRQDLCKENSAHQHQ